MGGIFLKLEFLENRKDEVEFKMIGERHSFPNLLKAYLLKNPDVEFVAYKLEHPFDNDSKFVVKTINSKDAKKAIIEACKELKKELSEFAEKIKKAHD